MVDTVRSQSALLTTLFQDGQTAGLTAQDMRDLIVSLAPSWGGFYVDTPAATTIGSGGTYVKMAGATTGTTATSDLDVTTTDNRAVYSGAAPRHFIINVAATLAPASGTNQDLGLQIYVYDDSAASGAVVAQSKVNAFDAGTDGEVIASTANVTLDTDDYVEIWITNETGAINVTASFAMLTMIGFVV